MNTTAPKTILKAERMAIARAKAARTAADAEAAKAAFDDANATFDAEAAAYDAETAAEAARAAETAYEDAFAAADKAFDASAAMDDAVEIAMVALDCDDFRYYGAYETAFENAVQNAFEAARTAATHDAAKKAAADAADAYAKQAATTAAVAYARYVAAHDGLAKLVACCAAKTGQGYKLRALLYSLWNGKPAALIDILALDRELREALLALLRVFGSNDFFYETVPDAFKAAGLFPWFLEESENTATPSL